MARARVECLMVKSSSGRIWRAGRRCVQINRAGNSRESILKEGPACFWLEWRGDLGKTKRKRGVL